MVDYRLDSGSLLRAPYKSPQGHLRVDAIATRTGVFEYVEQLPDGTLKTRHELRHPDQVFDSKSLSTLPGLPATLLHPDELVTPDNFKEHGVGTVGDEIKVDNPYVKIVGNLQRSDAIRAVESGVEECSLGYLCRVVPETGVWEGQKYDHRQYDIQYNHWAIVPRGRASEAWPPGIPAKIGRGDSADSSDKSTFRVDSIAWQKKDSMSDRKDRKTVEIAGKTFTVDEGYVKVDPYWMEEIIGKLRGSETQMVDVVKLQKALNSIASEFGIETITPSAELQPEMAVVSSMDAIHAKVREFKTKIDALAGENIALKKQVETIQSESKNDSANSELTANFDAAVDAKVDLLLTAKTILGAKYDHTGKSNQDIMIDVYGKFDASQKFDGLSAETINGMYLVASSQLLKSFNTDNNEPAKKAIIESQKNDATRTDTIAQKRADLTAYRTRKRDNATA